MTVKSLLLSLFMPLSLLVPSVVAAQTTWDVSVWGKPRAFTAHISELARLVDERSGGTFTLRMDYGGLASNRENLDGIAQGSFEMAQFCVGYHEEKTPSLTVAELPFLGVGTLAQERGLSEWLYQQPEVVDELSAWNAQLLMPTPLPQYNIIGSGDAPTSVAALAGLRVRATGGIARALETLGVQTVALAATEVGAALANGEIDAVAFAPHAHMSFNTIEAATWWTSNLNPGTVHCPVVMNTDALDALPQEHRDILLSAVPDAMDHYIENYEGQTMDRWAEELVARNIEVVEFTQSDTDMLHELSTSLVVNAWVTDKTQMGVDAAPLVSSIIDVIDETS